MKVFVYSWDSIRYRNFVDHKTMFKAKRIIGFIPIVQAPEVPYTYSKYAASQIGAYRAGLLNIAINKAQTFTLPINYLPVKVRVDDDYYSSQLACIYNYSIKDVIPVNIELPLNAEMQFTFNHVDTISSGMNTLVGNANYNLKLVVIYE